MSRFRSVRAGPIKFKRPSLTDVLGVRIGAVFVFAALPLVLLLGFWAPRDRGYTLIAFATMLGVFIAVAGLDFLVASPLRRLGSGIDKWRSGKGFSINEIGGLPHEFRSVALSFKKSTLALNRREADLVQAIQRQDLAMQEIHHRVKNNLQVVASLLNLQASRIRVPEAKNEFQAARDRVRALATVHRHLYAHGEINTINMRVFLTDLCGPLLQAMGQGGDERIRFDIDAPELQMTSDQAVPLSLIVTEAVTNAIKYGFPMAGPARSRSSSRPSRTMSHSISMMMGSAFPPAGSRPRRGRGTGSASNSSAGSPANSARLSSSRRMSAPAICSA